MLYGVAIRFDPLFVFATTLTINIITVFGVRLPDRQIAKLEKRLRSWLEKRTARGQRLINKYAGGIILWVFVLSPIQIAIVGRLLGIHSNNFYPTLVIGTVLSAVVSMAIALGIFKLILHW